MKKAKELTKKGVLSFLKGRDYSKTNYLETAFLKTWFTIRKFKIGIERIAFTNE